MMLYNKATDTAIRNVKPYYSCGRVLHYIATDDDTGEKIKIEASDIKNWKDARYVDVEYIRGNYVD